MRRMGKLSKRVDRGFKSAVLWSIGGLSAGMTALIFITIMAIGKADAAQQAASDAKTTAATVATDISWIKRAVERIEKKMGEQPARNSGPK